MGWRDEGRVSGDWKKIGGRGGGTRGEKRGRDGRRVVNLGVGLNDGHFVYWCHHWRGKFLVFSCVLGVWNDDAVKPEPISRRKTHLSLSDHSL